MISKNEKRRSAYFQRLIYLFLIIPKHVMNFQSFLKIQNYSKYIYIYIYISIKKGLSNWQLMSMWYAPYLTLQNLAFVRSELQQVSNETMQRIVNSLFILQSKHGEYELVCIHVKALPVDEGTKITSVHQKQLIWSRDGTSLSI